MRLFAALCVLAARVVARLIQRLLRHIQRVSAAIVHMAARWDGPRFAATRLDVGQWGEWWAASALKRRGYRVLFRRWSDGAGELDLVAWKRDRLIFVEVKARRGSVQHNDHRACQRLADDAVQAVDLEKQRRITRAALRFKKKHRLLGYPTRFDIVVVVATDPLRPVIQHWENAFDAVGDLDSMY
ncbi:MAG TPA: YraN family protein [Planctomycetaceae bacterium]|nr:YraN family protein [Planctomycetaceae bacterium]